MDLNDVKDFFVDNYIFILLIVVLIILPNIILHYIFKIKRIKRNLEPFESMVGRIENIITGDDIDKIDQVIEISNSDDIDKIDQVIEISNSDDLDKIDQVIKIDNSIEIDELNESDNSDIIEIDENIEINTDENNELIEIRDMIEIENAKRSSESEYRTRYEMEQETDSVISYEELTDMYDEEDIYDDEQDDLIDLKTLEECGYDLAKIEQKVVGRRCDEYNHVEVLVPNKEEFINDKSNNDDLSEFDEYIRNLKELRTNLK